jgi:hypothetical protein
MKRNTELSQSIMTAFRKGMKVLPDGTIIGILGKPLRPTTCSGYRKVCVRVKKKRRTFHVAHLQAYQKYGSKLFKTEIVVRHKNGNPLDDSRKNIKIGTDSDNMMDRPFRDRLRTALLAAKAKRRFTRKDIRRIRKLRKGGLRLIDIASLFGTYKGHISMICNRVIYNSP